MSEVLFPPALGQGCVCVESRIGDARVAALLAPIDDAAARAELTAERALLSLLDGSCRTPIAGLARVRDGRICLHGLVAMPDGSKAVEANLDGEIGKAAELGREVGRTILDEAGPQFMAAVRTAT